MPIESAPFINSLDAANPLAEDKLAEADDHLRLIKASLKATLPNLTGAVIATQTELNLLAGVSELAAVPDPLLEPVTKVKTADTTISNDTTYTTDPHLAGWTLEAASVYEITGLLRFDIKAASDLKFRFDFTDGFDPQVGWGVYNFANSQVTSTGVSYDIKSSVILGANPGDVIVILDVHEVVRSHASSAITMDFEWAQNIAIVEDLILKDLSFMTVRKIA